MTIIKASGNNTEKKLTFDRSEINSGETPEKSCDCTDTGNNSAAANENTCCAEEKSDFRRTASDCAAENSRSEKNEATEGFRPIQSSSDTKNKAVRSGSRLFGSSEIQSPKRLEKIMPLPNINTGKAGKGPKKPEFSEITLEALKNPPTSSEASSASPSGELKLNVSDQTVLDDIKKKLKRGSLKGILGKIHFRKRNAIVAASLALICGALVINHTLTGGLNNTDSPAADDGSSAVGAPADENAQNPVQDSDEAYFSSAAVNRRRARDESLEVLQLVVDSEDALQESKDNALQSMSKIAAQIEQESNIESLIKAKGFEDCIAVVSDSSATVIVASEGLLANEVAQITEIVCEQTSLPAAGITIIEKAAG